MLVFLFYEDGLQYVNKEHVYFYTCERGVSSPFCFRGVKKIGSSTGGRGQIGVTVEPQDTRSVILRQ